MGKEFLTEDQIVLALFEQMKDADGVDEFIKRNVNEYHFGLGRTIRNDFLLWDQDNPYTMKGYVPQIIRDVDCNPRHPDNTSGRILEKLQQKLKIHYATGV